MKRASNKAERLLQIEALLLAHPEGLTQAEVARRLRVNRSTIYRYLPDLEPFCVYETGDGRLAIDRDHYLANVRLTLHEAMAFHLAARLMATRTDKHSPHAASALRKLGIALERLAPLISHHLTASADVMDDAARRHDPVYLEVLETLTRAWSQGRMVHMWHKHEPSGQVYEYDFAPYFIEPYAVGQTTHVIGWREPPGAMRTFKLERIQRIELAAQPYTIPEDFDPHEKLADAWGIWYTEAEPVEVVLRFHPRVASRVRETRWHRSETVEEQPDGSLVWRAQVAEPREMLPWIRGWGADVEVLEPKDLRERLIREVRRLARVYDIAALQSDPQMDRLLRCWGKTARGDDAVFHPALFHMLDVGHVARVMLADPASPRWRRVLAHALDVDAAALVDWLPYAIATHDIGKLTAAFQSQNAVQFAYLKAEGFSFGSWRADLTFHHTVFGQAHVQHEQTLPLPDAWANLWQNMVGGHHGVFGSRRTIKIAQARLEEYEAPLWKELRVQADRLLRQYLFTGPMPESTPSNLAIATIALTGFAILCDWLGSDDKFFQPAAEFDLPTYLGISADRARRAVNAAGFFQTTRSATLPTFGDLFPDKKPPRPIQAAVDAIPQAALDGPALVIIEAPTGEGKTEAALAIAHRLAQTSDTDALYYALPTTATSNQMFKRVREHMDVRLRLPGDVQLIHGQAHLQEDDMEATPLKNEKGADTGDMVAWFTSKKRAMLAPFGVGTVDQAELAALNVKHVALRLVGLAGKVVIFDEVHAYDTYMTTIVARLLEWLAALDTSVIILSATLPQAQRTALARAYGANLPADNIPTEAYPSLWVLPRDGEPYQATPDAYQPERPLDIHYLHLADDAPEAKAHWLLDKVRDGGCACWITNTVARAQDIYDILRRTLEDRDIDLGLLHARFPLEEREKREEQIVAKYGPPPGNDRRDPRPPRGIVVGTQVLEQSLDLDFDVMVSDLAPIDLLLQRAGRLHRHARQRPPAHADRPVLWINAPKQDDGDLDLGTDAVIYAEYFLRQTWNILQSYDNGTLRLPHDYRPLVEAVYSSLALAIHDDLTAAWKKLQQKQSDAVKEADERLIPEPTAGKAFCRRIARLTFEEDETGAAWVVAQTRLGRESVNLIPLEKLDDAVARLYPGDETVALDRAAAPAMQRRLLRRHLRVSRPEIVEATKRQGDLPVLFTRSPRLKGYYPLWLENGQAAFSKSKSKGKIVVTLDQDLGLVITSQSEPKGY